LPRPEKNLDGRNITSLIDVAEMTEPEKKAAMGLLMNLNEACLHQPALHSWILVKMTNISLKYGHVPESSVSYAGYGKVLAERGDCRTGYAFGLLGLELSEKFRHLPYKCQACFLIGAFLNHWVKHVKWAESVSMEGYKAGSESGDLQYTGYILAFNKSVNAFFQGKNLGRMLADLKNFLRMIHLSKNQMAHDIISCCDIIVSDLVGMVPRFADSEEISFETYENVESKYLSACRSHKNFTALCFYHILRAQMLYLYEESVQAHEHICKAGELPSFSGSAIMIAEYNFYTSLILTAIYPDASAESRKRYRKKNRSQSKSDENLVGKLPGKFSSQIPSGSGGNGSHRRRSGGGGAPV